MMAVILAGGRGTRLKPFTVTVPKPLLPLGDVPILEVVIRQLVGAKASRLVLALGHQPQLFMASIGDGRRWGVNIEYCVEDEPLGTAASLRLVPELDENFLVMNGDLLTTLDYRRLYQTHVGRRALGTIALSSREVKIDYGVITVGRSGSLAGYSEKPVIPYLVSTGIYVLSKRCLEFIPKKGKFDMPQLMLAMKNAGRRVLCFKSDCYWQDIGRFDDYERASADFVADPSRFVPSEKVRP
ncbi:MAG: NTP transferase domain-containing protein [Deltaproteobacteria bacterium]|nr:NTP transferase domain-containing protein [Deltaproteobacteria bacterium]